MDTRAARNAWPTSTSSFRQPLFYKRLDSIRVLLNIQVWPKYRVHHIPITSALDELKQKSQLYLASTAISKGLHDGVNLLLKDLCEFATELVDPGCLPIVEPGIVEHEPDVVHILPGLLVLPCIQLPLDGGKVHGILHNVKIILKDKRVSV